MNKQERPIVHYRFYYDSDSEYDSEIEEDPEYESRPEINIKKKITKKQIQQSLINIFDTDDESD